MFMAPIMFVAVIMFVARITVMALIMFVAVMLAINGLRFVPIDCHDVVARLRGAMSWPVPFFIFRSSHFPYHCSPPRLCGVVRFLLFSRSFLLLPPPLPPLLCKAPLLYTASCLLGPVFSGLLLL